MAQLLNAFRERPRACSYLPGRMASLDVRLSVDVTAEELGALLALGWRRFGPTYFRPACEACDACIATRIPVATFQASTSQRRAHRQASRLVRTMQPPRVDDERLDLYARWHSHRESSRGWEASPLDADGYTMEFAFPHPSVREVTYRDPDDGDRLVGLGIVDEVPDALSAVYFFWDPDHAPSSLGTAHIVSLIAEAAARGLMWMYLGYLVEACPSLAYKARFQPQESLHGRPADHTRPVWITRGGTGTSSPTS